MQVRVYTNCWMTAHFLTQTYCADPASGSKTSSNPAAFRQSMAFSRPHMAPAPIPPAWSDTGIQWYRLIVYIIADRPEPTLSAILLWANTSMITNVPSVLNTRRNSLTAFSGCGMSWRTSNAMTASYVSVQSSGILHASCAQNSTFSSPWSLALSLAWRMAFSLMSTPMNVDLGYLAA